MERYSLSSRETAQNELVYQNIKRPENLCIIGQGADGKVVLLDPDGPNWACLSPSIAAFVSLYDNKIPAHKLLKLFGQGEAESAAMCDSIIRELLDLGMLREDKEVNNKPANQPHSERELTAATIYLTRRCNLNCQYCFYDAGIPREQELSTEECLQLIDELASMKVKRVNFMGGEPLLRKDIFLLAQRSRQKGLDVNLITNGTLINREIAGKIREHFPRVQVSLDGLEPEHDFVRGKGSFNKTVQGMKNLLDQEIQFAVSCIISRRNLDKLDDFVAFLVELGVPYFHCVNLQAYGRGACHRDMTLDFGQYIEKLYQLHKKYHGLIAMNQFAQLINPKPRVNKDSCGVGELLVEIDADGNVYPCYKFMNPEHVAGNIRTSRLADIYQKSPLLQQLCQSTTEITPECKICDVRAFCGGGCLKDRLCGEHVRECEQKQKFWKWVLVHTREGQVVGEDFKC